MIKTLTNKKKQKKKNLIKKAITLNFKQVANFIDTLHKPKIQEDIANKAEFKVMQAK